MSTLIFSVLDPQFCKDLVPVIFSVTDKRKLLCISKYWNAYATNEFHVDFSKMISEVITDVGCESKNILDVFYTGFKNAFQNGEVKLKIRRSDRAGININVYFENFWFMFHKKRRTEYIVHCNGIFFKLNVGIFEILKELLDRCCFELSEILINYLTGYSNKWKDVQNFLNKIKTLLVPKEISIIVTAKQPGKKSIKFIKPELIKPELIKPELRKHFIQ